MDGVNIDIWFDPWLHGSSLIDKYGWNSMKILDGCHKNVSMLFSNNNWKHSLSFIPMQSHTDVRKALIHHHMKHDFWWWIPNKQGHFSLKFAWNIFRNKHNKLDWTKFISNKGCAPKMSTCSLEINYKPKPELVNGPII